MSLLSAFDVLMWRYSGQEDILIGTPVAGRSHPELEGLIGLFVNTLALRAQLSGDLSVEGLLAQTRAMVLEALARQETPFEFIVEAVNPQRSTRYSPLVQVMFILNNTASEATIVRCCGAG